MWRSSSAEFVANQPKAPFIGPKGAFKTDAKKWANANNGNYSHLQYDGQIPPQRQPPPPVPAGMIQESMTASDDMKAIMGLHDASMGIRTNETSGVAIKARDRQGQVSTFNFVDNLSLAMSHCGRILVDLIPHIYDAERVVRTIGADEQSDMVAINQIFVDKKSQQKMHDLSIGKYDVTVSVGPSFGTKREEAAESMVNFIHAYPPAAPLIGDLLAKNLDWPNADKVAERLKIALPPQFQDEEGEQQQVSPQIAQQMQEAIQILKQQNEQLTQQTQELETQVKSKQMEFQLGREKLEVERAGLQVKRTEVEVDAYEAETERAEKLGR
jgi:hypothetical protein